MFFFFCKIRSKIAPMYKLMTSMSCQFEQLSRNKNSMVQYWILVYDIWREEKGKSSAICLGRLKASYHFMSFFHRSPPQRTSANCSIPAVSVSYFKPSRDSCLRSHATFSFEQSWWRHLVRCQVLQPHTGTVNFCPQ